MWILSRNSGGRPTLMHRRQFGFMAGFTVCGTDARHWSVVYVSDEDAQKMSIMMCKNCKKEQQ